MKDNGYKIRDEFGVYYLAFAVVQWVDVFSRKSYVDIVLDSLKFCIEQKQLKLFAWSSLAGVSSKAMCKGRDPGAFEAESLKV